MGNISFQLRQRNRVPDELVERAYMADLEGIPVGARVAWEGDRLVFTRPSLESGHFHIPWRSESNGELLLTTGTLIQRESPYLLAVELARGTLNRLINQLHDWEIRGLETTEAVQQDLRETLQLLAKSATLRGVDSAEAESLACQVLDRCSGLTSSLIWNYTNQAFAVRRAAQPNRLVVLGSALGNDGLSPKQSEWLCRTFNTAAVPLSWHDAEEVGGEFIWSQHDRHIQWAQDSGISICGGPLLSFDAFCFPDWLYLWEDDPGTVHSYIQRYVEAAVRRYHREVDLWHGVARINIKDALPLDEDARLNIAVSAVKTLRQVDAETPLMISFDQPWGEYLNANPNDPPPISYADAMLRMDLNVSLLGIELNLGFWPHGTGRRDVIQIGKTLDQWSVMGLPIIVFLRVPSGVVPADGKTSNMALPTGYGVDAPTPTSQTQLVADLVPHLLAKPYIQGVIWNQWSDSDRSRFPNAGLLDEQGKAKSSLQKLFEIRKQFVNIPAAD